MNKSDFKQWFHRWYHHGTKDPLKRRPKPFRDWHHLIVWWLILLIATSALQLFLFRDIQKRVNRGSDSVTTAPFSPLDPARLHQVVEYWRAREPGNRAATTTRIN